MGIEPTSSAWKAEVLPLNYTRADGAPLPAAPLSGPPSAPRVGGGGRIRTFEGISRQIYSLLPLAARAPLQVFQSQNLCIALLITYRVGVCRLVPVRHPLLFRPSQWRPFANWPRQVVAAVARGWNVS